jgi:malonyl-CoA O-methyltransferase
VVDDHVHVNRFAPLDEVRQAALGAGFQIQEWLVETEVRHYAQLSDLTRELKALGAHNLNRGRNNALTGRKQIATLKSAYESQRQPQGLPASWEILYGVLHK